MGESMKTLTGPTARDRAGVLSFALVDARNARARLINSGVRDDAAYRAAQDLVAALARLNDEVEVVE